MMAKRKEAIRKIGNEEKNMGRGERGGKNNPRNSTRTRKSGSGQIMIDDHTGSTIKPTCVTDRSCFGR